MCWGLRDSVVEVESNNFPNLSAFVFSTHHLCAWRDPTARPHHTHTPCTSSRVGHHASLRRHRAHESCRAWPYAHRLTTSHERFSAGGRVQQCDFKVTPSFSPSPFLSTSPCKAHYPVTTPPHRARTLAFMLFTHTEGEGCTATNHSGSVRRGSHDRPNVVSCCASSGSSQVKGSRHWNRTSLVTQHPGRTGGRVTPCRSHARIRPRHLCQGSQVPHNTVRVGTPTESRWARAQPSHSRRNFTTLKHRATTFDSQVTSHREHDLGCWCGIAWRPIAFSGGSVTIKYSRTGISVALPHRVKI